MVEAPFLQARFRDSGLVFGRFTTAEPGCHADLRIERIKDDGIHGRFAVHGIDEERTRRLEAALARRYGAPTHLTHHAHTHTTTGRISMARSRLAQVASGDLFALTDAFGPPWLRFQKGEVFLRAPLLDGQAEAEARRRARTLLHRHDPEADIDVAPLQGRMELIWRLMQREEAQATSDAPALAPDGPVA